LNLHSAATGDIKLFAKKVLFHKKGVLEIMKKSQKIKTKRSACYASDACSTEPCFVLLGRSFFFKTFDSLRFVQLGVSQAPAEQSFESCHHERKRSEDVDPQLVNPGLLSYRLRNQSGFAWFLKQNLGLANSASVKHSVSSLSSKGSQSMRTGLKKSYGYSPKLTTGTQAKVSFLNRQDVLFDAVLMVTSSKKLVEQMNSEFIKRNAGDRTRSLVLQELLS
jgi:hypothetical protein